MNFKVFFNTSIAKIASIAGSVIITFALAYLYNAEYVGQFALAQSVVIGLTVFCKMGLDVVLMRKSGETLGQANASHFFYWIAIPVTVFSLCIIFLIGLFIQLFFYDDKNGFLSILLDILYLVPFFVLLSMVSALFKGASMPIMACLSENGIVYLIFSVLLIIGNYSFDYFKSGSGIAALLNLVAFFYTSLIIVFLYVMVLNNSKKTCSEVKYREILEEAKPIYLFSLFVMIQSTSVLWILGYTLEDEDVGIFRIAQQIALSLTFFLMVTNTIYPSYFSSLYSKMNYEKLFSAFYKSIKINLFLSFPFILAVFIFSGSLFTLLEAKTQVGPEVLRVMLFGQLVNIGCGSVILFLNMSEHGLVVRNITAVAAISSLVIYFLFSTLFGLIGASIAFFIITAGQNIYAYWYIQVKLKSELIGHE